jgi:TRAP-type C4-dicarboxylate transport system permease small subunit
MYQQMAFFEKAVRLLTKYCDRIAQMGVMAMMLLAVSNIILRLVWKAIMGTYDYIEFIGATLVAFAIAYCALQKGHIQVELIVSRFPRRVQGVIGGITGILGLGIFSVITWQSLIFAGDMRRSGDVSMTMLLPFYPYIYGLAFGTGLLCLVVLMDLIKDLTKVVKG